MLLHELLANEKTLRMLPVQLFKTTQSAQVTRGHETGAIPCIDLGSRDERFGDSDRDEGTGQDGDDLKVLERQALNEHEMH